MIMKGKREQSEKFLNRELPVFAFFLLLSFVFWYLNELSKELQGSINYPVLPCYLRVDEQLFKAAAC